eukprot:891418-Prymnesium_polylepis.1
MRDVPAEFKPADEFVALKASATVGRLLGRIGGLACVQWPDSVVPEYLEARHLRPPRSAAMAQIAYEVSEAEARRAAKQREQQAIAVILAQRMATAA